MKVDIKKEDLERLYIIEGKTSIEIGKIYSVDSQTIRNRLRQFEIPIRKGGVKRKYDVNHDFFDNFTEKSARIIGLIASDGNLLYCKNSYRITFINKDIELCNFVKENLGGNISVKGPEIYCNIIRSEKIFKYLTSIGVTENKSKTLKIDFSIFNKESLLYAFLIGVLDGDGCVKYRKVIVKGKEYINPSITIATGSSYFKDQIKDMFPDFVTSIEFAPYLTSKNEESGCYTIGCERLNSLVFTIDKITKAQKLCGILSRKYEKMIKIKEYAEREGRYERKSL